MRCPHCNQDNRFISAVCVHCGKPLSQSTVSQEGSSTSGVNKLIPYKNMPALIGYYLGLFSCFPVIGLLLAIAAVVLGYKGLQNVKQHPECEGRVHAWVALVTGTIGLLINLFLIFIFVGAALAAQSESAP
ncbi:MAG: DUF4190 domain-containing protein [Fimbriimonadales bacterium]